VLDQNLSSFQFQVYVHIQIHRFQIPVVKPIQPLLLPLFYYYYYYLLMAIGRSVDRSIW